MTRRRACLLAALVVAGWVGVTQVAAQVAAQREAQPRGEPDLDVVTVITAFEPAALDPHLGNDLPSFRVLTHVYETLVVQDAEGTPRPGLAVAWRRTDATTWTFELRPGVRFHDGTHLRASDVVASLERLRDPAIAAPASALLGMVDTVTATGDDTVRITTHAPFGPLLSHLAHPATSVVSAAALRAAGPDRAAAVVGTGPFRLERWVPGSQVELRRFEDWWGGAVGPERVVIRPVLDPVVRAIELEAGRADVAFELQPLDAARLASDASLRLVTIETLTTHYLGFNTRRPPFDDARVRRAVRLALDVAALVDAVYHGTAAPATAPIAPSVFGASSDLGRVDHDPDGAREALLAAGLADGFTAALYVPDDPRTLAAAVIVQAQLEPLGIGVRIVRSDFAAYLADTAAGRHDMLLLGWGTVTRDADYGLYAPFHSSQAGAAGNRSFYANPGVDELLDRARSSHDSEERLRAYDEAQRLIHDDAPWVYLAVPVEVIGFRADLDGLTPHPAGLHQLHGLRQARNRCRPGGSPPGSGRPPTAPPRR